MEIKQRAYIYLTASLLIGSFTPALLLLTVGTNAFEFFFFAALASIPVGLLLVIKNKKFDALIKAFKNKKTIFYIAIAALFIYIPYEYGIAYAEHFISASLATAIFRLNPLLMLIFLPVFLKERLTKRQILALVIAFVGIVVGVSGGNLMNILGNTNAPIILFGVLLAIGYAFANVIIKWQMIDNDVWLAASTIVLTVFFGILFLGTGASFAPLNISDDLIILYLAITNIFSFGMYMYAFKVLKTTLVTNVFLLSPFLTFVWAAAFFAQPIQAYYLVIAALVSLGIVLQRTDRIGGSYAPRKAGNSYYFTMFDVTGAFVSSKEQKISDAIKAGGRVIATKVDKGNLEGVIAIANGSKFTNVYVGEDTLPSEEANFVKDVLGIGADEAIVVKAGANADNDDFFNELAHKMPSED